jgi:osmotically-inducible protein OsmY
MFTRTKSKIAVDSVISARARAAIRSRIAVVAAILAVVAIILGSARCSLAYSDTALMHRVDNALRANRNLNGAAAYTTSPGVVVLYGKVFDEKDRLLAEKTARRVPGVKKVINTLRTSTGQWLEEEARIDDTLLLNGFQDVSAKVIGPEVYLSGQVSSEAEKQRAATVVSSISNKQVNNFIWVKPGPLFSTPNFF